LHLPLERQAIERISRGIIGAPTLLIVEFLI
jgi:hypothetical protein